MLRSILASIALASPTSDGARDDLAALLERARASHGLARFDALGKELLLEGSFQAAGLEGTFQTRLASDGRFATANATRLPTREGFDGKTCWRVDSTGVPRKSWFAEREHALLESGLSFGGWCREGAPMVVVTGGKPSDEGAATQRVRVRARDGELEGRLEVDVVTGLPSELRLVQNGVEEKWKWSGWRKVASALVVPGELVIDDEGQLTIWRLVSARLVEPDADAFAMPTSRPKDTTFDPAAPSRLAGHATRTGHLVVKTKLDGKDVGFFIFDSGAGGTCIDPDVANELGMDAFGDLELGGAGAERVPTRFRSGTTFTLGPVTIERPTFVELELDPFGAALGEKLAGICGYDLLQRVVADVDMDAGTVDLFDPATFERDGVTWRELVLAGNHPHVAGTFAHDGEEEGLFRLDTGAGQATVMFHAPYVVRLGLLEGRKTVAAGGFGGVGGLSKARSGQLPWFELAGLPFDEPWVTFIQDERGAFADPWTAGTIGSAFLERFDLILDYPHGRIGFIPHE